jgi:hypothetical protein
MRSIIDISSGLLRRHIINWKPIQMSQFECPDFFGEQSRIVLADQGVVKPNEEIAVLGHAERCFCGKNGFWLWLNKIVTAWKVTILLPSSENGNRVKFYFGYCSYPGGKPVPLMCPEERSTDDGPFALSSTGCPVTIFAICDGVMNLHAKSDLSEEGKRLISEKLISLY